MGTLRILLAILVILIPQIAYSHEPDHPELDYWYTHLMQPDNPTMSCCGEADAYWCDEISVKNDNVSCAITDDRVIPGRPMVPVGTLIQIPPSKYKFDKGNPTGHAVVFMARNQSVYCFVQGSGT